VSPADDAREAMEAAAWRNVRPGTRSEMTARVTELLAAADAYARTAADAVTEAHEADAGPAQATAAPKPPGGWTPGFVHLATDGGIACNNRAPIPASKITTDPLGVSCSICRNSRKFKAVA
jgi:hypothetical protein